MGRGDRGRSGRQVVFRWSSRFKGLVEVVEGGGGGDKGGSVRSRDIAGDCGRSRGKTVSGCSEVVGGRGRSLEIIGDRGRSGLRGSSGGRWRGGGGVEGG